MLDLKEHLRTLVEAHAPSGHEAPIRALLREAWRDYADEFIEDKLGSLIGIKRATRAQSTPRKIMLSAHMDEIGLMVRDIVDSFIYVHRISGIDNRVMW
jgi:tetrahedral aminopeptidase